MKKLYFSFILLLSCQALSDFQEEDNVFVLDDSNFDSALKLFPYLLVEFYAPWCGHCKTLAPEFSTAGRVLKSEHIFLAKVDCTVNKKLAGRYHIKGYPTLKFFRSGKPQPYEGKRTSHDIIEWMKANSVPLITNIENQVELNLFRETQKIILMYFSKGKQQELDQILFETMADKFDGVYFGLAQSSELRHLIGLEVDERIVLYTPYEQDIVKYTGDITKENIQYFVYNNSFPTVGNFNRRERIFIDNLFHPSIFLFIDEGKDQSSEELAFRKVAIELKDKIAFTCLRKGVPVEKENLLQNKLNDRFGLKYYPSLYIYDPRDNQKIKYQFDKKLEINEESITNFIYEWSQDNLEPYYKSEKVQISAGPVKKVVGKSYQWEVIDNTKDVLLLFFAPWDENCKKLLPIYEKLAKELEPNTNLVLAKMDATENEIPNIVIPAYPTIKFYKRVDEKLKIISYYGDKTAQGLLSFLKENVSYPWLETAKKHDDL